MALSEIDRRMLVLEAVHSENLDGRWARPMGRAIERQRPQNVKLLLDHGANTNGVDRETLVRHARRHRRLCQDVADLLDLWVTVNTAGVGHRTISARLRVTEIRQSLCKKTRVFWRV